MRLMEINIFMEEPNITSLGPFTRYGVWFYGCDKHCRGCIYHEKDDGSYKSVEVEALVRNILSYNNIEGVTISGGEPFLQFRGLELLVKKLSKEGLGIIVYTGKLFSEIAEDSNLSGILRYIDLLIDGEYVKEQDYNNSLIGSANQTPYFLTPRYADYSPQYKSRGRRVSEVTLLNNEIHSVGIPTEEEKIIFEAILQTTRKLDSGRSQNAN